MKRQASRETPALGTRWSIQALGTRWSAAMLGTRWNIATRRVLAGAVATLVTVAIAASPGFQEMREASGKLTSVIVRELPGSGDAPERAVETLGGSVGRHIGIIDGFVADVPSGGLARLGGMGTVHSVTPNRPIRMQAFPDGYDATSDPGSLFKTAKITGAMKAWRNGITGQGVDVALIDTGVVPVQGLDDPAKIVNGPDLSFDSQVDGLRYQDSYGHGTHMAGIIAGRDGDPVGDGYIRAGEVKSLVGDGYDPEVGKTLVENGKLEKVTTSNREYVEVKAGYGTTFAFQGGVPLDSRLDSVKLTVVQHEELDFQGTVVLEVHTEGLRVQATPLQILDPTMLLGETAMKALSFDLSEIIETPEAANAVKVVVRNSSTNGKLVKVDSLKLNVGFTMDTDPDRFLGIAPDARLVNVKVGDAGGVTDVSQVLAAIDWVVQHRNDDGMNIRVLNLSFGTDGVQDYRIDPLTYAAEVAWRQGIVVVAAAGNTGYGGPKLNNPAYDPFILAVGAVDTKGTVGKGDDVIPDWSARGNGARNPDLVAPGKSITSLRAPGSYVDDVHPSGYVSERFFRGSGTSQAAAVASGAAALLLEHRPGLTPDQVKALLTSTARALPLTDAVAQGSGELNIRKALRTETPTTGQAFEPATGTGSLHEARGTAIVTDEEGNQLTGEQTIFGDAWDGRTWAGLSFEGRTWAAGDWLGRTWAGEGWNGSSWAGRTWAGRTWAGRTWAGRTWAGDNWTEKSWDGRTWAGRTWAGRTWAGRTWAGRTWADDSWSGRTWAGVSWD